MEEDVILLTFKLILLDYKLFISPQEKLLLSINNIQSCEEKFE